MKKNLRVGVIGLGLGRMHLAGYARNEEVNVIGLADVDAGRLRQCAKQYGIANTFTTYRELLKLKPDLVSVCLPNYLHARVAIDALKAGAHVLCEKPMATNAAEAQRMVNAAHRSERFLMIAL
ncbi:MAG: Gfo/Idh/MocA family oxidoreductase, partial [candidate division Zixibacteria bacterium]|nr:Gfo/Idh/MocA family oxidoreductase [candidate division Zixibacteria bacterium]